jgi:hypothetical protein
MFQSIHRFMFRYDRTMINRAGSCVHVALLVPTIV